MDCPSDTSSWYWLAIIGLVLLNWWLFGKWKDSEKLVPDFYDSEDEVSKHRKRQKRKEKLEKAREEREKRISAAPPTVTVTRSADGQVTTTVDPEGRNAASRLGSAEELSWEQDDSTGLVPVEEDDDASDDVSSGSDIPF